MKMNFLFIALTVTLIGINTAEAQVRGKAKTQRQRINQGVRSGELTRAEAANLRNDQREIRQDVRAAKTDDGVITRDERQDIRQDQRQASRKIYRKKNNARDRN
jgi:hypothetical protein